MIQLNIFERSAPAYHPRLVGVVNVDKGTVAMDHGPEGLSTLIGQLVVDASGDGGRVKPTDPNFHLAVADSIGRQSNWQFTAEVRE